MLVRLVFIDREELQCMNLMNEAAVTVDVEQIYRLVFKSECLVF